MQPERLLSRDEAIRILRVSKSTLVKLYSSGELRFVRIGRRILFNPDDLAKFISKNSSPQKREARI